MTQTATRGRALTEAGIDALRRSDARAARPLFEQAIAQGEADGSTWLGLAIACELDGDREAMSRAADRVLEYDPRNLRAMLMKGDALLAEQDRRAALRYYNAAMSIAAQSSGLKRSMIEAVTQAAATRDRLNLDIEQELLRAMAASGYDPAQASPRFRHALDLLSGRREIYLQQPRAFYFPELPQIQFYAREQFDWVGTIESATAAIREELERLLRGEAEFEPYIRRSDGTPMRTDHPLLDSGDWGAFFLWKNGAVVAANARRCPRTMAVLEQLPLCRIPGRTPSVLFSRLKPGTRIPPHNGFLNTRLICHLPLLIPPQCGLRVGNETRNWEEGKVLVFDDTIEHEAWNASTQPRIVMIFEIWRPELTAGEREHISALMQAIDATAGASRTEWSNG